MKVQRTKNNRRLLPLIILIVSLLTLLPLVPPVSALSFEGGTLYYVPVTLTNSQTSATSANLQVKVTINFATLCGGSCSSYSTDLSNINWQDGSGNILKSWRENGISTSDTADVYWVNLGSNTIAANGGTLTIYICFYSTSSFEYTANTGEFPYASTSARRNTTGLSITNNVQEEPSVFFTGGKFKMVYDIGGSVSPQTWYADSTDGISWSNSQQLVSGPTSGYSRENVLPVGSTFYLFAAKFVSAWQVYEWKNTTSDLLHWTAVNGGNPILTAGGGGSWDSAGIQNTGGFYNSTSGKCYLLYDGNNGGATPSYDIGLATSTDCETSWTKYGSNPVISGGASGAASNIVYSGGKWWVQVNHNPNYAPTGTDPYLENWQYYATNSNLQTWTVDDIVMPKLTANEHQYVTDPFTLEHSGKTYYYYTAQAKTDTSVPYKLKVAVYPETLANFLGRDTYGKYDSGSNVFSYYTNFKGPSLPSGWAKEGFGGQTPTVTLAGGIRIETGSIQNTWVSYTASTIASPAAIDSLSETEVNEVGQNLNSMLFSSSSYTSLANLWGVGWKHSTNKWDYYVNSVSTDDGTTPTWSLYGFFVQTFQGDSSHYQLKANFTDINTGVTSFPTNYIDLYADEQAVYTTLWVKTRVYPPVGVLPSISIGSFTAATVTQPIKITVDNSGAPATFALSGCNPSPATILTDGAVHNIVMAISCTMTITVVADTGTIRYRFSGESSTTTVTSCGSGTCSEVDKTVYEELSNTFQWSLVVGTTPTGVTWKPTGTQSGTGSSVLCTSSPTVGSTSGNCAGWGDYGRAVTAPAEFGSEPANERLRNAADGTSTIVSNPTTGGNTYTAVNYYVQWSEQFKYAVTGGGTPTAPHLFCTYLGTASSDRGALTTSYVSFWADQGTNTCSATDPTTGSTSSERWSDNGLTFSPATPGNHQDNFAYYHQYSFTLSYAIIDGGSPTAPTLTYTKFGASQTPALTTSATVYWMDNSQTWSVTPNPLTGSGATERWYSSETLSGTVSSTSPTTAGGSLVFHFYHQYKSALCAGAKNPNTFDASYLVVFKGNVTGTANTVIASLTVQNGDYSRCAGQPPPANYWSDATKTVSANSTLGASWPSTDYQFPVNSGGNTYTALYGANQVTTTTSTTTQATTQINNLGDPQNYEWLLLLPLFLVIAFVILKRVR